MPRGRRRQRAQRGGRRQRRAPTPFQPPGVGGLPGAAEMAGWKAADETRQRNDATRAFREAERQPWGGPDRDRREPEPSSTPGGPPFSPPATATPSPPRPQVTPEPRRSAPPPPELPPSLRWWTPMDLPAGHPWQSQYLQEQRSQWLQQQQNLQVVPAPAPRPGHNFAPSYRWIDLRPRQPRWWQPPNPMPIQPGRNVVPFQIPEYAGVEV